MPLKSETRTPPCGWIYFQPETGWRPPKTLTTLNQVATALRKHRLGNPHLKLNTDLGQCKTDICEFVCAFLKQDPAWCVVPLDADPVKKSFATRARRPARVARSVADDARRVSAGARILYDWLGSGGKEVASSLARQRAQVCVQCPKNQPGDWKRFFTGPVARIIRAQLSMRSDLKLQTDQDDRLGYCQGCGCWLPLKVWVPMDSMREYLTQESLAELDPKCWVPAELERERIK